MTRARAIQALDDALGDSVKQLFNVLVMNLLANDAAAPGKFHNGMAVRDDAYAIGLREIETIFPD